MPARLILICHAATDALRIGRFPADEDLDPGGLASLATLAPMKAGSWLSGPELRVRRTAHALSTQEIGVDDALRDWDLGLWRGRTLAGVAEAQAAEFASWLSDPLAAPHGGESLDALRRRVTNFLAGAAARGGREVAVTHPAVVRAAIVVALGADAAAFWRIDAPPLTRARLSHDGRRWVLQALQPANKMRSSASG